MFIVYKLTNRITGKSYIGLSSRGLNDRWSEHQKRAREGKRRENRLYAALTEYGPQAFDQEVLETVSSKEAAEMLETQYIVKFDTYNNGYNCNLGGAGFLKFPEHIKKKISKSQKGKIISPEVRAKMSEAKRGDARCASHLGDYVQKGAANPLAKSYLIQFPDGTQHVVKGLNDFCKRNNLHYAHMRGARKKSKGYVLLKRFNDQSESSYTQAGGNGGLPT